MPNYRIGQLDQRVELQRVTLARAGGGGQDETWATYATVWAHVRPMSGRERQQAMRNDAISDYLVVIRYRAGVLEADRIVWRDRTLNIRFLKYQGPRESFLEIEAELGVPT